MSAAAFGALGLLVLLPWTPALISSHGLTPAAFNDTPLAVLLVGAVAILGRLVMSTDRWLGLGVIWGAILVLIRPQDLAVATAAWFGAGVGCLMLLRTLPASAVPWIRWGLLGSASTEIVYRILQHWRIDPFWFGWAIDPRAAYTGGSFLNPKYVGAMAAMAAPLAPVWLLPWLVAGVCLSKSYLALTALAVGLVIRWRAHRVCVATSAILAGTVLGFVRLFDVTSAWERLDMMRAGVHDLLASPIVGHGFGGWAYRMNFVQCPCPPGEMWIHAHNEWLQWVYETGLIGAVLLACWSLATVRALLAGPRDLAGGVGAAAVLAGGLQILHIAGLASVALLLLGGALAGREPVNG